ncbi:hypothetical protein H2O64_19810 [Kordia sp. YSTF-M3]|uniref:SMI1/KNR4 family protein n=1 Tax=Kordia aestuariivivens TaxID=2759037 RepID=A0ABR7QEK5_9FLAO|nr:hypothetical protein [Kordia aestuariivivens]MBC8756928.1 hypothetical protein [Kordia aestuariivivens]
MLEYKFYKWTPSTKEYLKVRLEEPYDYLSMIFEGNETSNQIQNHIENIIKVINGNPTTSYSIENQSGFIGYAFAADPSETEYPEGGFQVFDFFTLDEKGDTKELFIIPLEEILNLLSGFKSFLKQNKK